MDTFRPTKKFWNAYSALYGNKEIAQPVNASVKPVKRVDDSPKEDVGQMALVAWARSLELPLIAIPNRGKRTAWQGEKERALGLTAGVSDLFLARPNLTFHGFWIEMKRRGKKPTDLQNEWMVRMRCEGYKAEYYDDWEKAKLNIIYYLDIE